MYVDNTTQEILKLAEDADPRGIRTMGVLSKPDLATEKAALDAAMDLLQERRRNVFKLGYHVVKNRSADDDNPTLPARLADERAFFAAPPWSSIPDPLQRLHAYFNFLNSSAAVSTSYRFL